MKYACKASHFFPLLTDIESNMYCLFMNFEVSGPRFITHLTGDEGALS